MDASKFMQSSFLQSLMKHNIPLPADQESRKLDWLLSINEEFFQQQLKEGGEYISKLLSFHDFALSPPL